jgi:hypothetical protein
MIELLYLASEFQCGANAPQAVILADVYYNGTLVADNLATGEKVLLPDFNSDNIDIQYTMTYANCAVDSPISMLLKKTDPVPNLPAAYSQTSLQDLLNGLESYEDLFLLELGTHNTNSSVYDLQDVVFIVNNNPVLAD